MNRQEYIDNLLDHYENPRNQGKLEDPTFTASGGNPGCGDIITMYGKVGPDGRLSEVSFDGEGCTISQASASMVTEMVEGKTLAEIEAIDSEALIDLLGREVVITRTRCATLALGTLKSALHEHQMKEAAK